MTFARVFILLPALILAMIGCKKASNPSPAKTVTVDSLQFYVQQMAGVWNLTGTENFSYADTMPGAIFYPTYDTTTNTTAVYQIGVVDSTTISLVTSTAGSYNSSFYVADTNRHLFSVDITTKEITFTNKWIAYTYSNYAYIGDVFDTVVYNYVSKTIAEREYIVDNNSDIYYINLKSR